MAFRNRGSRVSKDLAAQWKRAKPKLETKQKRDFGPSASRIDGRAEEVWAFLNEEHPRPNETKEAMLVLAWVAIHKIVTGISPAHEVAGKQWGAVHVAAKETIAAFSNDEEQGLNFVKWAWERERSAMEWRAKQGRPKGRLTWQRLFRTPTLRVDYVVEMSDGIS